MELEIRDDKKKDIFTKLFKHLTSFTESINIRCKPDRFYIQGMDSSHISLFELILEKDWFDKFEVADKKLLGINLISFSKILCFRDKEQNIRLKLNDDGDKLFIGLSYPDEKGINKAFQIPLLDIEEDLLGVPLVEYTADFIIETKKIRDFLEEMSTFGNAIKVKCSEEEIEFSSDGDEGFMKVKIDFDDVEEYQIDEDTELELDYASKYILWMLQYSDIVEMTHLFVSKKYPMQIYYSLGGNNFLRFYVAPLITDY